MTLRVIIIRAEGALAETEDVRRAAYAAVFREAGFDWACDRAGFAETSELAGTEARMAHYVRQKLKGRPETSDLSLLISAMHRRAGKVFSELLERGQTDARSCIRDVLVGARSDGLKVAVATTLTSQDAGNLLGAIAGGRATGLVDIFAAPAAPYAEDIDGALYASVRERLGHDPHHAIVIEATPSGAKAAKAQGFPVIVTRSASLPPSTQFAQGGLVIDSLSDLIASGSKRALEPLTVDGCDQLVAALHRVHLGNCENAADLNRSDLMRVSDILKAKGAAVKTVEPGATIRALAQGLRSGAVGAMPVIDAGGKLHGIISERDLARGLAEYGSDLSAMRVSDLMTRSVVTCQPEDAVATVAGVMTQRRIRHLPVVVQGTLVGLISIGDVLKHRLDEVQLEASVLRDVAMTRR